jgi:hypothetical protein
MKTVALCSVLQLCFVPSLQVSAFSQTTNPEPLSASSPQVIYEDHHDTSAPLSQLVQNAPLAGRPLVPQMIPLLRPPDPGGASAMSVAPLDPVIQSAPLGMAVPISSFVSFDGMTNTGYTPPDSTVAVGATQIVETVNASFAVFTKAGSLLLQTLINNLWFNFGGPCQAGPAFGDPVVLYDKLAGRWLITDLASGGSVNTASTECIAVSTTSDATGTYNRYAFNINGFGDYPKFGAWPDAYYASYNYFFAGDYFYPVLCAYNRSAMLVGGTANSVCFQAGDSTDFTFLPSDLDGSTVPPSGSPNFYIELARHKAGSSPTSINMTKFHVDFVNPNNSTLTNKLSIPVALYTEPCDTCVPQSGTTQNLDTLGDRLMHRLEYRNFGDHESLVVSHAVVAGSSIGMRWYEIRSPNGTPTVFQQGTYAPDSNYRWMGSIAMDKFGNIALGYSISGSGMFPSIRFTGRPPQLALGTMKAETTIIAGGGAQLPTTCPGGVQCGFRWGDYTSMAIDPVDDTTFVYTNEYHVVSSDALSWSTRIASFKLGPFLIASVSPASLNFGTRRESDPPVNLTTTLTNNGGSTLNITSVGQGLSGGFSLFSNGCGATLAPGNSCMITVRFTPANAAIGLNTGTLKIVDNADNSPQNVSLTGTMTCPPAGCL